MKDKKNLKISIIIPTWNRKKKLLRLLNIIIAKFQKQKIIYEIIICDSFSTDGTQIAVSKNYGKNKNIRYENIKNNNDEFYKERINKIKSVNWRSKLNHFAFQLNNPLSIFMRNICLKYLTKNEKFLKSYLGKVYRN